MVVQPGAVYLFSYACFQKQDESKAMKDLNDRIQQLTKLILTSNTVEEGGSESRPASPVKVDFDMSPYQVCCSTVPGCIML